MFDELEADVEQAIDELNKKNINPCLMLLNKVKGALSVLVNHAAKWERVQKEYESGVSPARLSTRYDLTSGQIRSKAYREKWINPNKIAKQAAARKNKNVFYIVCHQCENHFETVSGHAKICPTCKAFEAMGKEKG